MKHKLSITEARPLAQNVLDKLAPYCDWIDIAGSIRRCKSQVGDIEIVCIPKLNIFGSAEIEMIDLSSLLNAGFIKNGPRYKQMVLRENEMGLDLFLVYPPASVAVIFTLRTGDATFSHKAVTIRQYGGYLPSWAQVKDGSVLDRKTKSVIEVRTEFDFLDLLGFKWIPPEERTDFAGKENKYRKDIK